MAGKQQETHFALPSVAGMVAVVAPRLCATGRAMGMRDLTAISVWTAEITPRTLLRPGMRDDSLSEQKANHKQAGKRVASKLIRAEGEKCGKR